MGRYFTRAHAAVGGAIVGAAASRALQYYRGARKTKPAKRPLGGNPPRPPPKRVKRNKKKETIHQDGTGTSRTYCVWSDKRKKSFVTKMIKWEDNPQVLEKVNQVTFETDNDAGTYSAGVQCVGSVDQILPHTDFVTMQNQVNVMKAQSSVALLPSYQANQRAFKLFVESAEEFVLFTNMTTGNIVVDIYDCVQKRDNGTAYNPQDYWQQGQQVDEAGTQSNTSSQVLRGYKYPFSLPYNSTMFKQFITVKKHVRVELAQGRSHEHTHKHVLNKMIDLSKLSDNSNSLGTAAYKGVTSFVMLVVRGQPCLIGAAVNNETATLASAKIAIVTRLRYKWRLGSTTPSIYTPVSQLAQAYGGSAQENIVSEGLGTTSTLGTA